MKRPVLFSLLLGTLLFPAFLKADIFQCDGKWTNKPCSEPTEKAFEEKALNPIVAHPDYSDKLKICERMKQDERRFTLHGIRVSSADHCDYCYQTDISKSQCREEALRFQTLLDKLEPKLEQAIRDKEQKEREQKMLTELEEARKAAKAAEEEARLATEAALRAQVEAERLKRAHYEEMLMRRHHKERRDALRRERDDANHPGASRHPSEGGEYHHEVLRQ